MVGLVKTRNASVALAMQGSFVKSQFARKNAKTVEGVSDQTDVPVCMAILEDTAKLTTEQDRATGRLRMSSALVNYKVLSARSSSAVQPLERRGDIPVSGVRQS